LKPFRVSKSVAPTLGDRGPLRGADGYPTKKPRPPSTGFPKFFSGHPARPGTAPKDPPCRTRAHTLP
jgi:hypothetical protein